MSNRRHTAAKTHFLQALASATMIILGVLANAAYAAGLSTQVILSGGENGCGTVTGISSASLTCGGVHWETAEIELSGSTDADFGFLGAHLDALLITEDNIPGDNIGGQISSSGSTRANFTDVLTISNGPVSGILQFEFDLENTTSFDVVPGNSYSSVAQAYVLLNLSVNKVLHQANTPPYKVITSLSGTTQTGSLVFNLDYSGGQTTLGIQMIGVAVCGYGINRGSEHCDISVDYLGTLLGTTVFDSDMKIVPDAVVTAESGFDYQSWAIGDSDDDGVPDEDDNCPVDSNAEQEDFDGDDIGDVCDDDVDGDNVANVDDFCSLTLIPETVPWVQLIANHWALIDSDSEFDTAIQGKGQDRSYTTTDTAGCSCEQIIELQGLGNGHLYHGCSISAMDDWLTLVN